MSDVKNSTSPVGVRTPKQLAEDEVQSAPVSLRERKKAKARLAIEKAALDLVIEHGYDGCTVEDICARAEVSKKTFFNYFPSKSAVIIGRNEAFPSPEELIAGLDAHPDECYLDVLVEMVGTNFGARSGEESQDREVVELRQKALSQMPQLFFRGQRDLLSVQKAVSEALSTYLENHPARRMMKSHSAAYEALVASSAVTALVRTRSMFWVFYQEEAKAADVRRVMADYLSVDF